MTRMKSPVELDSRTEIRDLGKFDLSQLYEQFKIATFERRVYNQHVVRLKKGIMSGRLVDNVITVFKNGNSKKWTVIDGQHRILSLWQLYEEGNITSFHLTLRIIDAKNEKEARQIYMSLNAGKSLTAKDSLKAFDDGTVPFFNELKTVCTHEGSLKAIPYYNVLSALHYIKNQDNQLRIVIIEDFLKTIEGWEASRMCQLVNMLYEIFGKDIHQEIFLANIFRPLARVYYEEFKDMKEKKFRTFVRSLIGDHTIKANAGQRTIENFDTMYTYFKKKYEGYR